MSVVLNKNLQKLKDKCNLPDEFMEIVVELFNKLVGFGYISKYSVNRLSKKLYDNIDSVVLSESTKYDYKSGYYDAYRKELYIKDYTNLQAMYLRLLYILTTKEYANNAFTVGFSKTQISKENYKIVHSNFGLNRAVVSNLVCRLLYTLPTTLSIVPTYRTYDNDFLGVKVVSDNDIYFLEGKLIRQLCFTLDINEEMLYYTLFKNNPNKTIKRLFNKINIEDYTNKLDKVSRMYSNYNKLCYFNKLINDNYLEIKKHCIDNTDVINKYLEIEKKLEQSVKNILIKLYPEYEGQDFELGTDISLSGKINDLEESIVSTVSDIQTILVSTIINRKKRYNVVRYAVSLRKLQDMLVIKNIDLFNEIYSTISHDIIHANEQTCTNMIEKIKYSLASYILSDERYARVYSDTYFKRILDVENMETQAFVIISNDEFSEIAYISHLNNDMKDLSSNTVFLKLKNLRHILNISNENTEDIENLYTKLKNDLHMFRNTNIENIFICKHDDLTFLLIPEQNKTNVVKVDKELNFKLMNLSESYNILGETRKNLPVVYKETHVTKLLSILNILR